MKIGTDSYLQQTQNYAAYSKQTKAVEETKTEAASTGVKVEFSNEGKEAAKAATDTVKVTRAEEIANKTGKMTDSQRASLAQQLKADQESRQNQLISMVESMLMGQSGRYAQANSIWDVLRTGNFTVDAATKAQAQADIAEDGYWGVEQTSDRILDFAKALTGGDPDKIEEMRDAFEKGFKQATDTWGDELPDISKKTYEATMEKFDKWAEEAAGKTTDPATDAAKEVAGTV